MLHWCHDLIHFQYSRRKDRLRKCTKTKSAFIKQSLGIWNETIDTSERCLSSYTQQNKSSASHFLKTCKMWWQKQELSQHWILIVFVPNAWCVCVIQVFDLPHVYCTSLDKTQWHPMMQHSTAGFYIIACSTISVSQKDLILRFTFPGIMMEKSQ